MAISPESQMTPEAYLAFERSQPDARHEFLNGEIIAMVGTSLKHNRLITNLVALLSNQLRG